MPTILLPSWRIWELPTKNKIQTYFQASKSLCVLDPGRLSALPLSHQGLPQRPACRSFLPQRLCTDFSAQISTPNLSITAPSTVQRGRINVLARLFVF